MSLLLLFAQDAPQPPGGMPGGPMMPLFIIGLVVLFLMVVVFPAQRRQKKDQEKVVASLKRGTKVLTNAGIVATVVGLAMTMRGSKQA